MKKNTTSKNTTSKNTKNTNTTATRKDTTMKKNMNTNKKTFSDCTDEDIKKRITSETFDKKNFALRWLRAWNSPDFYVSRRKRYYSPYNRFYLAVQEAPEGEYATFDDIVKEGGNLKGKHGYKVTQSWTIDIQQKDKDGNIILNDDGTPKTFPKPSGNFITVFNVEECGLKPKHERVINAPKLTETDLVAVAETTIDEYVKSSGIKFKNKSTSAEAYYSPSTDTVRVPRVQQYNAVSEYYSTAFHELIHSTGHPTRRHRFEITASKFGSKDYSKEELVAESGAVLALARLGLATEETFMNSIAYLINWLKSADRNDGTKRNTLFAALQSANSAVNMIFAEK